MVVFDAASLDAYARQSWEDMALALGRERDRADAALSLLAEARAVLEQLRAWLPRDPDVPEPSEVDATTAARLIDAVLAKIDAATREEGTNA